jgi:nicotinamidase-related amidase
MNQTDLPAWAHERGAVLNAFDALDTPGAVLVNIDMQSIFIDEGAVYGNSHARDVVGAVNALSAAMRRAGYPVIWTRQTYAGEGLGAPAAWQYDLSDPTVAAAVATLRAGEPGHGLHAGMAVEPGDIVIDKFRYGALSCPVGALRAALERGAATMVVIAGTLTNVCCESTARELNMAGYKVIVVSDAMAAVTDAEHNAALLNLRLTFADVKSTADILRMIDDQKA